METSKKALLSFFTLFVSLASVAQIGGNQLYNNNHRHRTSAQSTPKRSIYSTDSTVVITSRILLNKEADSYIVTLGVNQEALTVKECNTRINKRIKALLTTFKTLGIKEKDSYVDFISQTKIYDHKVNENKSEQVHSGFEIKKNIILTTKNIAIFDQLVELSADQQVFNIVKVEYIDTDIESTYDQLFDECTALIKRRKNRYFKFADQKVVGTPRIISDNFYSLAPKNQYKAYTALETSKIQVHNSSYNRKRYVVKEERKSKTFYFNGKDSSGFDKVINNNSPKIPIQYVLEVSVLYELKR